MTATTMHFGPEWMRTKQGSSRPAPSPPLTVSPAPPGTSSYSALLTPNTPAATPRRDDVHPFRYSKEEMLRIYKEGGGRGGLGLEVERWEGIVRELGCDPVGLKEPSDAEKKILIGSLNSELRRRQSTDFLSPLSISSDRPKLNHAASGPGSPMRERIGSFMGRRRDSTDQPPSSLPRKLSLSSIQAPLASPREAALPSPRARIGHAPGFDGVLSESWSSRRRAAEAAAKASGARNDKEIADYMISKGSDIKEEEEEIHRSPDHPPDENRPVDSFAMQQDAVANGSRGSGTHPHEPSPEAMHDGTANSSTGSQPVVSTSENNGNALGTDSATADLAGIEWSYLDPQGQIQGPFRADTMQRWHNEGYFSPDLRMKRTHLDSEWISVGDMLQRAGDRPIFLTPIENSTAPPGLPRRSEPLFDGPPPPVPDNQRRSPYQPVPTSSLRSLTLDSYLQNGSSASNSPSSSFGANRFVNGSPDPGAFDGRSNGHYYNDPLIGSRVTGFATGSESPLSIAGQRRATLGDAYEHSVGMRTSMTNLTPGRSVPVDGLGFSTLDNMTASSADSGPFSQNFPSSSGTSFGRSPGVGVMRGPQDVMNGHSVPSNIASSEYGPIGGFANSPGGSRVVNRDIFASDRLESHHGVGVGGPYTNGFTLNGQQFSQNPSLQYPSQDAHSLHPLMPPPERQPQAPSQPLPMSQQPQHSFASSPNYAGSQSQWIPQEAAPTSRRPGPFDTNHPTASNTVVISPFTPPQVSYNRAAANAAPHGQLPWSSGAQGAASDSWGGNNLTIANLGQHNQQQQNHHQGQVDTSVDMDAVQAESTVEVQPESTLQVPAMTPSPLAPSSPIEPRAGQKGRRKSTAPTAAALPAQPSASKVLSVAITAVKPPSPLPQVDTKPAWATEDDVKKAKSSSVTLGLREIQEAESKKSEARKAAERERERATRTVSGSATATEDFQPFTTSWGLPTSQAGTARPAPAVLKDSPSNGAVPTAPVWTNAVKAPVAKRTMKEIQEEEERRKKQAVKEKETAAATARRAYAETTNKSTPPVQPTGGVWTTVGSAGKVAAPVAAAATRPAAVPSVSVKVVPSASSVSAASVPTPAARPPAPLTTSRPTTATKIVSPKSDEAPAPPSHEFLKWMSESLKGLNSSVNIEDISSMLLSFPLDPDSSTVEIISDLIYASSTTLDGRRFASDFVSRRKADATSRKGGVSSSASGKVMSIADVVKAQPKPAQNEWGGFKVVNKKKKGGKA